MKYCLNSAVFSTSSGKQTLWEWKQKHKMKCKRIFLFIFPGNNWIWIKFWYFNKVRVQLRRTGWGLSLFLSLLLFRPFILSFHTSDYPVLLFTSVQVYESFWIMEKNEKLNKKHFHLNGLKYTIWEIIMFYCLQTREGSHSNEYRSFHFVKHDIKFIAYLKLKCKILFFV